MGTVSASWVFKKHVPGGIGSSPSPRRLAPPLSVAVCIPSTSLWKGKGGLVRESVSRPHVREVQTPSRTLGRKTHAGEETGPRSLAPPHARPFPGAFDSGYDQTQNICRAIVCDKNVSLSPQRSCFKFWNCPVRITSLFGEPIIRFFFILFIFLQSPQVGHSSPSPRRNGPRRGGLSFPDVEPHRPV